MKKDGSEEKHPPGIFTLGNRDRWRKGRTGRDGEYRGRGRRLRGEGVRREID